MNYNKLITIGYIILIIVTGLFLSGNAAVYSVFGIAAMYAGSYKSMLVTATIIEVAKLVVVSVLYRYRNIITTKVKVYLWSALVVLLLITSFGVYGHLVKAHQASTLGLNKSTSKLELLESDRERYIQDKNFIIEEKQQLQNNLNTTLSGLVIKDSTRYLDDNRRRNAFNRYKPWIDQKNTELSKVNVVLDSVNNEISELKLDLINTGVDVGPLLYVADAINEDMDVVLNWFTLLLMFVFDPLGVLFIYIGNIGIENFEALRNIKKEPEEEIIESEILPESESESEPDNEEAAPVWSGIMPWPEEPEKELELGVKTEESALEVEHVDNIAEEILDSITDTTGSLPEETVSELDQTINDKIEEIQSTKYLSPEKVKEIQHIVKSRLNALPSDKINDYVNEILTHSAENDKQDT